MSRRTVAAIAIATMGVIGVAGAATAATVDAQGFGSGLGFGFGNGLGIGSGYGNGDGTTAGSHLPLRDGSGGHAGGWGRAAGGQGQGTWGQGQGGMTTHQSDIPAAVPGATISPEVADMLTFMVQEEQLARDVYALAVDEHGDRVFVNINRAESNHMAEVKLLLDRYDVADPTEAASAGSFTDTTLTAMYADLAAQVATGRAGAIDAGIAVETADIADLRDALAMPAPADVTAVLGNLLAGSERHLAAFQRNA